jgi:hypothetical protein
MCYVVVIHIHIVGKVLHVVVYVVNALYVSARDFIAS